MHFFCELTNLPIESQSFGPIEYDNSVDPVSFEKIFNVASKYTLTQSVKAFACQSGKMIVQQSINPNLVNVIIKPDNVLLVDSTYVKYYIYRGLLKSSFISGGAVTPQNSSNSEFIKRFWTNWNSQSPVPTNPPTKREFGYDPTMLLGTNVESVFSKSQPGVDAVFVKEGEWIGDFAVTTTGEFAVFEILSDTDHFNLEYDPINNILETKGLNVAHLSRSSDYNVDIIGMPESTATEKFNIIAKREEILSYVDPAAFFGMHYSVGVTVSTVDSSGVRTSLLKSKEVLYEEILIKFNNKNRVYIDIRSEYGYSYNYYQNYNSVGDDTILRVQIEDPSSPAFIDHEYNIFKWPIFYESSCNSNNKLNKIKVQLKTKNNSKPLLFIDNKGLWGNSQNFIDENELLDSTSVAFWSKPISLNYPNWRAASSTTTKLNVAHHIKLHYFKQENSILSPSLVAVRETDLDQIFGEIDLSIVEDSLQFFGQVVSNKYNYVKGQMFSFVASPQLFLDTNNAIFLTKLHASHISSEDFYSKFSPNKTPNPKKISDNSDFPQEVTFQKIKAFDGTDEIHIIDLSVYNFNKAVTNKESLFILGITNAELTTLKNAAQTAGISPLHKRRIVLNKAAASPPANGIKYQKYELNVIGLKFDGTFGRTINTGVFVYSLGGYLFNSKDFGLLKTTLDFGVADGGTLETSRYVGQWEYDADILVPQLLHPTGFVKIDDTDTDKTNYIRDIELRAIIHYPSDTIDGTLSITDSYPLILIVHGNGQDYFEYINISRHFARNGFIAASISCLFMNGAGTVKLYLLPTPQNTYTHIFFNGVDAYLYNNNSVATDFQKIALTKWDSENNTFILESGNIVLRKKNWLINVDFTVDISTSNINLISLKARGKVHDMYGLGRSNMIYNHLEIIKKKFQATVQNNIAIMGHSRGGESVVMAANELLNPSSSIFTTFPTLLTINGLKTVISLAPTDQYPGPAAVIKPPSTISPTPAVPQILNKIVPYLVIYGSKDQDVSGSYDIYTNILPIMFKMGTGFSLYDRARNQEKSMIFVYGATHNGFITNNKHDIAIAKNRNLKAPLVSDEYIQRGISFAYANAMLRKNILGENVWEQYFTGEAIPESVNENKIYTQFERITTTNERVIYPSSSQPSLSGVSSPTYNGLAADILLGDLRLNDGNDKAKLELSGTSPHDTNGVTLNWEGGKKLMFTLPTQNISSYQILSIRISNASSTSVLKGIKIGLSDGSNLKYADAPDIPIVDKREDKFKSVSGRDSNIDPTKNAMQTIRIQLTKYQSQGINLSIIKRIEILFPSGRNGRVTIDNILFTN